MNTLPAGLLPTDNNIEFFASHDLGACALNGGRMVTIDEFSDELLATIRSDMQQHPKKVEAITRGMGITAERDIISQYMVCNYGGFDNTPDFVAGKLQKKEYWPCPKRANCRFNGIVCDGLITSTGKLITQQEIKVLQRIACGELDKEIAAGMGVAESTVASHTRNIRNKTGLSRKAELTRFATENKLV